MYYTYYNKNVVKNNIGIIVGHDAKNVNFASCPIKY